MSDYAEFIREIFDVQTFEDERGFFNYAVDPKVFLVRDIYIRPEFRKTLTIMDYLSKVKELARDAGFKEFMAMVSLDSKMKESSTSMLLKAGFKISHFANGALYFKREV